MRTLFACIIVLAICGCTQPLDSTPSTTDTADISTAETYIFERNLVRKELVDQLVVGESNFEDVWEIMLDACDEPDPGAAAMSHGMRMYAVTEDGCNLFFDFDYEGHLIYIKYEDG